MVHETTLENLADNALLETNLAIAPVQRGKVRDIYEQGENLAIITTDRLSAFDRVLGAVPYKGQVLNQLSLFWFEQLKDIIPNYVVSSPHPNVTVGTKCAPLPVEVIVRGYITGVTKTALWYRYNELGERSIYGHDFPEGLTKNQALPEPIITPTTKGGETGHDERLTVEEVVTGGYVEAAMWQQIQDAALAIFKRGQEIASKAGLILVDTKYEFGIHPEGHVVIIDEVHTPDSSRYWLAESYQSRIREGLEPENFDKEFVRLWYAEQGYRGDGAPPAWSSELAVKASQRYQQIYEMLTGNALEPAEYPLEPAIASALTHGS